MLSVTIQRPCGAVESILTTKFTEANAAYWAAVAFAPAGTEVEASGFIPRRSNPYRSFSYGKRESAMHAKHEAVVPKNARMVRA